MSMKYSYFQLTFGDDEAFRNPEKSYERLKRFSYDAIELTPPKGRYGKGVSLDRFVSDHLRLTKEYDLSVSCLNDCWGEEWDPHSPDYKTLTGKESAKRAISETITTIDMASELNAKFVTVAVAIHEPISSENVDKAVATAVDSLQQMCDYASKKDVSLVFEATNHLEMGKFVNTVANHKRLIELTGCKNLGIQIDWFHAGFEELNCFEAVYEAQPLLWHQHFRDTNSLTPGYGNTDFKAVMRALLRFGYEGYCTIESSPMYPDVDTAVADGISYLKYCEKVAGMQLSKSFPNGFPLKK
ncbi:MAG: sugar phosphate isomerase/epimerase [Sphaerochaetaceae bacterium]|nr:sugar phosphate isomerase/epimerase [Sphaerochaetaceae bacterium]